MGSTEVLASVDGISCELLLDAEQLVVLGQTLRAMLDVKMAMVPPIVSVSIF